MLKLKYEDHVILDDGFCNYYCNGARAGYMLTIGLNYYRSLPLSCIEEFELTVDGGKVDNKKIQFRLNGKQFMISQLPDLISEYWFVLDKAQLVIDNDGGLSIGEHNIELKMIIRSPYMYFFSPRAYMRIDASGAKMLTLKTA